MNKFEIKERTVYDDIRFIKERLLIEVLYDSTRMGYYNSTPDRKLPQFDLTEEELSALMLGKDMLVEHSGTIFKNQLEQALAKIASRLADKEQIPLEELQSLIRVLPGGVAAADGKTLLELKEACDEQRSVEIEYYAAHTGNFNSQDRSISNSRTQRCLVCRCLVPSEI